MESSSLKLDTSIVTNRDFSCKSETVQPLAFYLNLYRNVILITETRLFKYTENLHTKKWKFSDKKKNLIFFIFLLKI